MRQRQKTCKVNLELKNQTLMTLQVMKLSFGTYLKTTTIINKQTQK